MRAAAARGWSKLRGAAATRVAAWARRRQGEDQLPLAIPARRVYILPTRGGIAYAALLFVMLLAGLNYSNSLALFITFLLAGFGLIAMHLCHRNLNGIVLRALGTSDAFVGEHGRILLTLENTADSPRLAIDCDAANISATAADVPAKGEIRAELVIALERRGRVPVDRLRLSTSFPYGLFRAWTWVHVPLRVLAWPAPRGRLAPPAETARGGAAQALHRMGDEEWSGLREFRSGDSPRQVAWGAYARGRGLLVKTYQSPASHHRLFDLDATRGDLEQRLEQLSAWIVAAHARGERYGVRIGGREIATDSGREHRARCLDALALHGVEDEP